MSFENLQEKFVYELGEMYDAERQFLTGQQEMLKHAANEQLRQGLQEHIGQTRQQIQNLDKVFGLMGQPPGSSTSNVALSLVKDAQQAIEMARTAELRDCVIDGAAAKAEHFEIAGYRSLLAVAEMMGQLQIASLLQENLQQEEETAHKLEVLASQLVREALRAAGTQPKAETEITQPVMETAGMQPATRVESTRPTVQTERVVRTTGDEPRVEVDTSGASDILVDKTQDPSRKR